ncbi:LacI family transcriptional regulator [Thiospirochaeta perfilievii]|uniref:LacI family transcriptional regulator n=1 Tax=Thiospirochaeta perfilievii TaxID=252967 RepID=A0A5C1Q969_9SPIO|nr:LacI family DNA-binding transcriptional regulator [Thiospirochaeta perfilievii]QEN03918.1 LacI family transcriptional regulator [Thiospirochaeta perfilievii]
MVKPTIKDVAKLANVSIATVSRVLNNLDGYSKKTKDKVEKAIKELNYEPNAIARGLVSKNSRTIGILLPYMHGRFSVDLLRGIDKYTHENNYSVVICNTDNNGIRTMEYIKLLGEKQVEGIIFASAEVKKEYEEELLKLNIPTILVSTNGISNKLPSINIDNYQAAYYATLELIKKGHKDICMISGQKDNKESGIPREAGFKQALLDNGLEVSDQKIYYGDFTFESGISGITKLKKDNPNMTAIFTASDLMALGVLQYAYQKRLIIPHELAVIGFDDSEDAKMSVPPLTTIHQPIEEMGILAAQMLIDKSIVFEDKILKHSVTIRNTI